MVKLSIRQKKKAPTKITESKHLIDILVLSAFSVTKNDYTDIFC